MLLKRILIILVSLLILAGAALLAWRLWSAIAVEAAEDAAERSAVVPVETAAVEQGAIEWRRSFSGTLESMAEFDVSSKISGRLLSLPVDVADTVQNGQLVAEFDRDEYELAVTQSEAELEVARADLAEARSSKEIADRAMQRQTSLRERGVASEVQLEAAEAEQLAAGARVAVARANELRAQAALKIARVRLGYTQVHAVWDASGADEVDRHVALRMAEVGDTVGQNTPIITVVALDPIQAVLFISEREYGRLASGQTVRLSTDAYPGETFTGQIDRISPVFDVASRQARVEITVPNPDLRLKPGMFVRALATLERVEDATIIPGVAVVRRGGKSVVFAVDPGTSTVRLVPVETGIQDGDRLQVFADGLTGRVVTLGQQLLSEGSEIRIIEDVSANLPAASADDGDAVAESGGVRR